MRWLAWVGALGLGIVSGWACGSAGADCSIGSQACSCTTGGACDPNLTCVDGTCVMIDCPVGSEGCTCTGGGACDPGLACENDICTAGGGTEGTDDGDTEAIPDIGGGADSTGGFCKQTGCAAVDMLFAIDSSLSMMEEIDALSGSQSFASFVQDLEALNCGDIDYRIGLTNDNDGGFIGFGANGNPWFDSGEMTAEEISSAFTTAAGSVLGNGGTAIGCEHVLATALSTLALDTSGFLRDDALLVLVLITDVDDHGSYDQAGFGGPCDGFLCTETPQEVQTIYDQLVTLKGGDAQGLAAIVVAGDPNVTEGLNTCMQPASCCGVGGLECGQAHHANRLYEFAGLQAGTNGFTGNICEGANQVPLLIQEALTNNIDLACQTYEPEG
ncbi:MAG: VWA domain-containing protein [Deltaproteobacteria bacterium]|nr:VWA domain-containing protein [Deltaproteobacteria bacterium]